LEEFSTLTRRCVPRLRRSTCPEADPELPGGKRILFDTRNKLGAVKKEIVRYRAVPAPWLLLICGC
jgi:hypothetical protein